MKNKSLLFWSLCICFFGLFACHPLDWELPRVDPECPCVNSIFPAGASFGEEITVTGSNFAPENIDQFSLQVGESNVSVFEIVDENTLTFSVPKGISSGIVEVTRTGCLLEETNCGADFTYYPSITSVSVFAGIAGETSVFNAPQGLAVDREGNVIVADRNHHIIQRINTNGSVALLAGVRNQDGFLNSSNGSEARFKQPGDVAVNPNNGEIYVVDEINNSIRVIAGNANRGVSTLSGDPNSTTAHQDGSFANASFTRPRGVAISTDGSRLFVTEFTRSRLRVLDLLTPGGNVSTALGTADGTPSDVELRNPVGVAFSEGLLPDFPVLVADQGNMLVRAVNTSSRALINVPDTPGPVLSFPNDMEADAFGNIYVADAGTDSVVAIFRDGSMVTLIGGGTGFALGNPAGIAIDHENNFLYVSDDAEHVVLKVVLE